MTMHSKIVAGLIALAAFLAPPFLSGTATAQAQQPAAQAAAPRIDGFDVEPVADLSAGNELAFTLYGSAGGIAGVRIGGATGSLILQEVEAGVYEGSYTISRRDRITAQSTATANLRMGNRVVSSVLDDSLVKGAAPRWPGGSASAGAAPKIDRFEVDPPEQLVPGAELLFTLTGSAGGSASVRLDGVRGKVALEEGRPGIYEGSYVVRNRDRIAANTVVTGNLRLGSLERSMVLRQALVEGSHAQRRTSERRTEPRPERWADAPAARPVAARAPACANCGVVEAVNVVEHKGDGSYIGLIAGGVGGALLGSQVGHGKGTTVAQLLGAAGGAFAGNEIEKRIKTTKHYEVTVRLENGGTQMVSYPSDPGLRVGARVRIENGAVVQI